MFTRSTVAAWLTKPYWNAFLAAHTVLGVRLLKQPLDRFLAIQDWRVRKLAAYAYANVIHYRELMDRLHVSPADFQTARDLEQLPMLSKDELLDAPDRFVGARYRDGKGLLLRSSGTSGRARTMVYDSRALFLAQAYGYRQRRALAELVGKSVGYREVDLSRNGGLARQLRSFYGRNCWIPRGIDLERRFISPADSFESIRANLLEFRPDVVRGYGSFIGALFRWLHEHEFAIARPKAIHYGGDRMAGPDQRLIEEEFGIPVYSTYQAAEALLIAFQCGYRAGFHISLDQVALRVVDDTGYDVAPGGTGEVVLTNLTNRGTVLINLKLGDLVRVGDRPCPCGSALPVIDRIEGRADDLISIPGRSALHPLSILPSLQAVPGVIQVQLVQCEPRRFQLRVVRTKDTNWPNVRAGLQEAFQSVAGRDLHIDIEQVERLAPEASGKLKGVISHCTR